MKPALIVIFLFLIVLAVVCRYLDIRESRAKVAIEAEKQGGRAETLGA